MNLRVEVVGGRMTINEYIVAYFLLDIEKLGIQVPIRAIHRISLKVIILVLARLSSSFVLHQDLRPLMFYAVDCLRPTIYH